MIINGYVYVYIYIYNYIYIYIIFFYTINTIEFRSFRGSSQADRNPIELNVS